MRHFTISVLSMFVILPAVASAQLPVVNIASGAVSARGAFGEDVAKSTKKQAASTRKKTVVARTANKQTSVDMGEQLVAANDVLMPRRPSNNLWAKSDGVTSNEFALRMPMASEFSVIGPTVYYPKKALIKKLRWRKQKLNSNPSPNRWHKLTTRLQG